MAKLVVFKLDGDLLHQGFRVTLEIGLDFARPKIEITGSLPPQPELISYLNNWQNKYRSLGVANRIKPQEIIYDGCIKKQINECSQQGKELVERLQNWLDSEEFRCINNTIREELKRDEVVRVLIRTNDPLIQMLPWHLWDFFSRYQRAEFALTATVFEAPPKPQQKGKVRILAILGNSSGIDVQQDQKLLENLPDSETVFLVEPQRQELNNYLWQQWDILFFAGHSQTITNKSCIYINKNESLTIEELKYGLKEAISQGLQLAIFNSCDGLGLGQQLAALQIPQMIVMRSPVPDEVAQEFLKHFLAGFANGKSLYLALREGREKLQGLEDRFPNATWLPVIFQNPSVIPPTWNSLYSPKSRPSYPLFKIIAASILITALVMGVRYVGILQSSELRAYDRLMHLRPAVEKPDPRLLIVTVNEADIAYQNQQGMIGRGSLSDRALELLLQKLELIQPIAIGLDIYRDFATEPSYPDLAKRLNHDRRIFSVCKVAASSDGDPNGIHPPFEVPQQRLTFSDIVEDNDEVPRRQVLYFTPPPESPCVAEYAFSLQVARYYLQTKGINARFSPADDLQIGNTILKALNSHTSGYQGVDASGYQILLNYRSLRDWNNVAETVSLKQILNDYKSVNIESLKNRIILIGVTAPSYADYWKTPTHNKRIPGVLLQAHMVSHILSAVEDGRPLLWWWSSWAETFWVWGWSLIGGIIAIGMPKPLHLGFVIVSALSILFGICFTILIQAGWIPLVPPAIALIISACTVIWLARKVNSIPNSTV